jgi:hypothetical protein
VEQLGAKRTTGFTIPPRVPTTVCVLRDAANFTAILMLVAADRSSQNDGLHHPQQEPIFEKTFFADAYACLQGKRAGGGLIRRLIHLRTRPQ